MNILIICVFFTIISKISNDCGHPQDGGIGRIIGGTHIGTNSYPWYGALMLKKTNEVNCGATLITSFHLLTAAHCYFGYFDHKDVYKVILGKQNICDPPNPSEVFDIAEVRVHEHYAYHQPFFDIALIRLERSALMFPTVCIPPNFAHIPRFAKVIGFGMTKQTSDKLSCTLQEASVTIYTREECLNQSLLTSQDVAPGTFCAGNLQGDIDTCQGDSGGPLLYKKNGQYYILGIVSFGYDCAEPGYLGIYTDIPYFKDWIETHTQRTRRNNFSKWWSFTVNKLFKRYTTAESVANPSGS